MTTLSSTRTLPATGTWKLDPGHAEVAFIGRHFMLTKVRGRFTGVETTLEVADDPRASTLEATIDVASVDSGDHARDEHLRSADLFDVERFPTATFRSTALAWDGASGRLTGDLTIRDITRAVTLDVALLGTLTDPWGNDRAVFEASGSIDRGDWGVTWNLPLDGGGVVVSKRIALELHLEFVRES